jgi:hypothetical protein
LAGALSRGEEPGFWLSSAGGVEIAGAQGRLISVLTRNTARRTFETIIAPTKSRAERGHDGRAVRTRERAWLTLALSLSDSSKTPNSMLPVVPSRRGNRCADFCFAQPPARRNCIIFPMTGLAHAVPERSPFMYCEDTPVGMRWDVICAAIPGPQVRGTGGTLGVVLGRRDQGHLPLRPGWFAIYPLPADRPLSLDSRSGM